MTDAGLILLRAFGLLYLLGGLWGAWTAWRWSWLDVALAQLQEKTAEIAADLGERAPATQPVDVGRNAWLISGALLTAAAGAAMLFAHRAAVYVLAALIVHQMLYFWRQRRRELRALSPDAAEEARPSPATVNGFFSGLAMAVLAAWLNMTGALV